MAVRSHGSGRRHRGRTVLRGTQLVTHRTGCTVPQFIDLGLEHTRRRLHGLAANDLPAELHDRFVFLPTGPSAEHVADGGAKQERQLHLWDSLVQAHHPCGLP